MRFLDAGDSINQGLQGFWPLDDAGGSIARDISPYRHTAARSSGNVTIQTPAGLATQMGSSGGVSCSAITIPSGATPVTIVFRAYFSNAAQFGSLFSAGSTTGDPPRFWLYLYLDGNLYCNYNQGGGVSTSASAYAGKWATWGYVDNGANRKELWCNGVLLASSGSSTALTSSYPTVRFGASPTGGDTFSGNMQALRFYLRCLTRSEMARVTSDAWAGTLNPRQRLIYLPSTGYTMAAGTGSYTLTGQAVGLKAGRLLTAGQGSYTLTGQAVTLKAGRRLPVDFGAFTLSGQDVAFSRGRVPLVAGTGTFSLTGQDVALKAGRLLTATTALYSISGRDATLVYSGATAAPAVGGLGRKRTKGFKRIRLPVAQPAVAYEASSVPAELKPIAKKAWQDDDDEWILLA